MTSASLLQLFSPPQFLCSRYTELAALLQPRTQTSCLPLGSRSSTPLPLPSLGIFLFPSKRLLLCTHPDMVLKAEAPQPPSPHELQPPSKLHPAPKLLKQKREAAAPGHQHGQLSPGTSTSVGGGVCSTKGPDPTHNKQDISLLAVFKIAFTHYPPAKKLSFQLALLPKALVALGLLLCTFLLILFTSHFIHHCFQMPQLLSNRSLSTLLKIILGSTQLPSGLAIPHLSHGI